MIAVRDWLQDHPQELPTLERVTTVEQLGILVVDDEPSIRHALQRFLSRGGFNVWVAGDGLEGSALYQQHQGEIDLVLLDVEMPGFDGRRTARLLRRLDPKVRFCFMTGAMERYPAEDLLDLGAVWVFPKPFPVLSVVEILRQLASHGHHRTD